MTQLDYIEKIAHERVSVNPRLLDIVQRVRENGLHKVASKLAPVEDLTLEKIAKSLGTQLLYQNAKYNRIHEGLNSMNNLRKHAGIWDKVVGGARQGWDFIGDMGAHAGRAATPRFGAGKEIADKMQAAQEMNVLNPMRHIEMMRGRKAMEPLLEQGEEMGRNVAQRGALVGAGALGGSMLGGNDVNQTVNVR